VKLTLAALIAIAAVVFTCWIAAGAPY